MKYIKVPAVMAMCWLGNFNTYLLMAFYYIAVDVMSKGIIPNIDPGCAIWYNELPQLLIYLYVFFLVMLIFASLTFKISARKPEVPAFLKV